MVGKIVTTGWSCILILEEFEVVEDLVGDDRTFLRLQDGRGFVSDRSRKAERFHEVVARRLVDEMERAGGSKNIWW